MGEAKLWGGRFTGQTDPLMELYNASLPYDQTMWKVDLEGTKIYTEALEKLGLISAHELSEIHRGLGLIGQEWQNKEFVEKPGDEDIHTANERRLGEIIGKDISGKVHTGRSRNDQVATDMRLFVRDRINRVLRPAVVGLIDTITKRARAEIDVLMPGYTHLQRA